MALRLISLLLFLAPLSSYGQGLAINRGAPRTESSSVTLLSEVGTVYQHFIADSTYCGASICGDAATNPDSVRYTDASGATPTSTTALAEFNATANGIEYDTADPDFNNKPVWRGTDGDSWFENAVTQTAPITWITVLRADVDTESIMMPHNGEATCGGDFNHQFRTDADHEIRIKWGGTSADSGTGEWATGTTYIATVVYNTSSSTHRLNGSVILDGVTVGSGTSDGTDLGMCNGASFEWIGEIAETVVFSEALTTSEIQDAECILSDKYALGLSGC